MEHFFNLSFLKYPISLVINMIVVGFYLYIFPPKEAAQVRKNEFAAINLDIPSADKKIEEKNGFNQNNETESTDFTAAEVEKNEQIELNNSRADFARRTAKAATKQGNRSTMKTKSISPQRAYTRLSTQQNRVNDDIIYQEKHRKTIEKLEERIQELTLKKKLSPQQGIEKEQIIPKNDGFSFKDNDLIPKTSIESDNLNPIFDNQANRFYSNNPIKNKDLTQSNTTKIRALQTHNTLIKGRLVESKIVRNNTTIKIMLTESKIIGNVQYESGDMIGAKTHIQGDRLMLIVDGYIKNDVFIPITAQAMDVDGLLGLKVSIDAENEMQKNAWGQNAGSTLGSVNPLLVYNPQVNIGQTVGNQVVGSLVNQSLNGANQYVNAKIRDVKVTIKTGQQLYLLIKN